MNITISRWLTSSLVVVAGITLVAGLLIERSHWAGEHPYLVNLLSAITGFAFSGAVAATVLNWAHRIRFYDAELDARSDTLREVKTTLDQLLDLFGLSGGQKRPLDSLTDAGTALGEISDGDLDHPSDLTVEELRNGELVRRLERLALSASRFPFLLDPALLRRCDRIGRKTRSLINAWSTSTELPPILRHGARIRAAAEVAQTLDELKAWITDAPGARMQAAVSDEAFTSDDPPRPWRLRWRWKVPTVRRPSRH